jgi:hypothetical protein
MKAVLLALGILAIPIIAHAETDNFCANPEVSKGVLMNLQHIWEDKRRIEGIGVVDVTNLTTLSVNKETGNISCHLTISLSNTKEIKGVYTEKISNSAGLLVKWEADDSEIDACNLPESHDFVLNSLKDLYSKKKIRVVEVENITTSGYIADKSVSCHVTMILSDKRIYTGTFAADAKTNHYSFRLDSEK